MMLSSSNIKSICTLSKCVNNSSNRLDIYEILNRTSSRIVRMAAASGLIKEFQKILTPKVKITRIVRARSIQVYTVFKLEKGILSRLFSNFEAKIVRIFHFSKF